MLPSLVGTAIFFVIPYLRVLYYSLIDNQFRRNFVWFENYSKTLTNEYFLLALRNSLLIIIICVPVLVALALVISLGLVILMLRAAKLCKRLKRSGVCGYGMKLTAQAGAILFPAALVK